MDARQSLGGFLRLRRARIVPASVGLPVGPRRRVPGLRREELAQLAGISVEYYQRLEQGRADRPSDEVLAAIARVLRLTDVERAHLRDLRSSPRPRRHPERTAARPELTRMPAMLDRVPALVINDRFDVLAANRLAVRLFGARAGGDNLARLLFLDPAARDLYLEWHEVAVDTVGQLRLAAGRYPDDESLTELIDELAAGEETFRTLWAAGDVERRTHGTKGFRHPDIGVLWLNYENFQVAGDPRRRLVTLSPDPGSPSESALHLLTEEPVTV